MEENQNLIQTPEPTPVPEPEPYKSAMERSYEEKDALEQSEEKPVNKLATYILVVLAIIAVALTTVAVIVSNN